MLLLVLLVLVLVLGRLLAVGAGLLLCAAIPPAPKAACLASSTLLWRRACMDASGGLGCGQRRGAAFQRLVHCHKLACMPWMREQ